VLIALDQHVSNPDGSTQPSEVNVNGLATANGLRSNRTIRRRFIFAAQVERDEDSKFRRQGMGPFKQTNPGVVVEPNDICPMDGAGRNSHGATAGGAAASKPWR